MLVVDLSLLQSNKQQERSQRRPAQTGTNVTGKREKENNLSDSLTWKINIPVKGLINKQLHSP